MANAESKAENRQCLKDGYRRGIPIGLGYLFVSFTLGIAAAKIGMSAFKAAFMSFSIHASAGEFAAISVIAAAGGYLEMALTELIVNLRYLLMSCSLSQKIPKSVGIGHRMAMAFDITDEIFALSVSVPDKLNPYYVYGQMLAASPGWVLGTFLGAYVGSVMPAIITGAMSIALYGMFMSVVIPPARKDKTIRIVVICSMAASVLFSFLPVLRGISAGTKIIILTVLISAIAALIHPVDLKTGKKSAEKEDM